MEIFEKVESALASVIAKVTPKKVESALTSAIALDAQTDTVGFYIMDGPDFDSIELYRAKCRIGAIDDEFLARFGRLLKLFCEKNPQVSLQRTALVLPDHLFFTDTFKMPVIQRKAVNQSLDLAMETMYKNKKDLVLNKDILQQNRKQITYTVFGMRRDLLDRLKDVCEENNVGVQGVTFAANAAVNGAATLNPRLKNGTYLLLDIKETCARFAFVVKGKTVGYYSLPFGYAVMLKKRVAAENMLFDHSSGELLVLNAKERARAKRLTMAGENEIVSAEDAAFDDDAAIEEGIDGTVEPAENAETVNNEVKPGGVLKKTARKLPKYMLRPDPQSREEYVYENFRLFVKWALELIASNPEITAAGMPEAVYVNMPEEFKFLYDMVNAEAEENKITFAPLQTGEGTGEKVTGNLELFGGLHVNHYNKNCNF